VKSGSDIVYGSVRYFTTSCQPVADIDGNLYNFVEIGTQTWMKEDLRTTKLNDGTQISLVSDISYSDELITPGYCWYENNLSFSKDKYGALYTRYAINSGKLCPIGWHVPTDEEWTILTNYLYGEAFAGSHLKEEDYTHWIFPNTEATNESGFTALPGGMLFHDRSFGNIRFVGYWWSSTEATDLSNTIREMTYNSSNIIKTYSYWSLCGFSVRCLKD